ncbi:MAG: hypothetical protein WA324_16275 [Bryobacteraceae bacterium]
MGKRRDLNAMNLTKTVQSSLTNLGGKVVFVQYPGVALKLPQ